MVTMICQYSFRTWFNIHQVISVQLNFVFPKIIENDVILQYLCIWQNEKSSANNETNEIYFRLTNEIYFLCVIMHNIRNHLSSIVNHRLMNRFGSERNYKSSSFSLGTNNCWHTCSQIADG